MVQLNPDFIKSMKDPNKNFAILFKVFVEEKDLNPDFIKLMKDPNKNFAILFKVFVEEKDTRKKKRKQNTNVDTICQLRFALQI